MAKGGGVTRTSSSSSPKGLAKTTNSGNSTAKSVVLKSNFTSEMYDKLESVWDETPTHGSVGDFQRRFVQRAVNRGYSKDAAEAYIWASNGDVGRSTFANIHKTSALSEKELKMALSNGKIVSIENFDMKSYNSKNDTVTITKFNSGSGWYEDSTESFSKVYHEFRKKKFMVYQ